MPPQTNPPEYIGAIEEKRGRDRNRYRHRHSTYQRGGAMMALALISGGRVNRNGALPRSGQG